jgi:hypothetical protein
MANLPPRLPDRHYLDAAAKEYGYAEWFKVPCAFMTDGNVAIITRAWQLNVAALMQVEAAQEPDADEFATLEPWEHENQRELSSLYNHRHDNSLQFNRGQMREAIQHGRRLGREQAEAAPGVVEAVGYQLLMFNDKWTRTLYDHDDAQKAVAQTDNYIKAMRPVYLARQHGAREDVREHLRVTMLQQPMTDERNTYSDGFAQGLSYAIDRLDAAPATDERASTDD